MRRTGTLCAALVGSALLALAGQVGVGEGEVRRDPDSQTIDDRRIARAIEREGGALLDEIDVRTGEEMLAEHGSRAIVKLPESPAREMDEAELYEKCKPGVLVVRELYKCDHCPRWHTAAGGTAFVLSSDGVCVTNYHMFENRSDTHVPFPVVCTSDGAVFVIKEVLAASHADDVAIFRLGAGRKDDEAIPEGTREFTPITLAESAAIGTKVALIAHPDNECYTLTTGIISRRSIARRGVNGDAEQESEVPTITVTCEYGVGSSGGPVMDMRGRAVGMVCNTHTVWSGDGNRREPQMVRRRCIPADRILLLLASPAPEIAP
ncbi:MAG: S1 family peptidase [Phycisphaerales bacterium]